MVAQHRNCDVNAVFWFAPGHARAFTHLSHKLDRLSGSVGALHVLIEICVNRLYNGRHAPTVGDEDVAARPTKPEHLRRQVRREVISHDDPPAPRLRRHVGKVGGEEVQYVCLPVIN